MDQVQEGGTNAKRGQSYRSVRVGLVDIKDLTEELETDEMQQVPEIHMLLYESLLYYVKPSSSSNFAKEKAKLRSTGPVSMYAFTFVSQRVSGLILFILHPF